MKKLKLEELNRLSIEQYKAIEKKPIILVLDSIRSAMNVGSIFRTADAFAISQIYLCGFTSTPPHKEITKTAIGATDSVEWAYFDSISDAVQDLKNKGFLLLGIEQTDKSIGLLDFKIELEKKYALIFGNEVEGIDDNIIDKLDYALEIPQYGTKHSLNVAVCAGIVIHHFAMNLN